MSNIKEASLLAFRDELHKVAAPNLKNLVGGASALMGAGGAVGGIAGAGLGAVKGYRKARQEGEGVGQSLASGASGILPGAISGAALGAGAGAIGGAALGHLSPSSVTKLTHGNTPVVSGAARFGQRQVHALTGWTPEGGIQSIGGGAHAAKGELDSAEKALAGASSENKAGLLKARDKASKAYSAASKAEEMGLTNIPGYAKSLKNNGVGATLKADLANQWHGASNTNKALMLGVPAVGLATSAASKDTVDAAGQGKGERLGKSIGNVAGGVVGSAMPIVGQGVVGSALGRAGGLVGKGVDRLRGVKPQELPPNTYGSVT